jgi:hypothetical protein
VWYGAGAVFERVRSVGLRTSPLCAGIECVSIASALTHAHPLLLCTSPWGDVVATVVRALAVLHGESTSNAQRQEAQRYCEQVKAHPASCLSTSLALLQMSPAAQTASALATGRHFALHSLQHLVAHQWSACTDQEKGFIKAQAISIAENVSTRMHGEEGDEEEAEDATTICALGASGASTAACAHSLSTHRHFHLSHTRFDLSVCLDRSRQSSSLSGGARFLKQTIARIVTDLALREWPQRWPNMMDILFANAAGKVCIAVA